MTKPTSLATAFLTLSLLGSVPAYAEYDVLLNNIYKAVDANAKDKARSQGETVSRLATVYISVLANSTPTNAPTSSLEKFPAYVGTAVGSAWQNYAEKTLTEKGREEVKAQEPEIRAQYNAGQTRRAVEADYAAKQQAILDRRAQTYGPPKPNAFY